MIKRLVWMEHEDHGICDFYDRETIEAAKKVGWKPCDPPKSGPTKRAAKPSNVLAGAQ